MLRPLTLALLLLAAPAAAEDATAAVSLTRLDCGRATEPWPLNAFDDTGAAATEKEALVRSCYLIRHGNRTLLWDTGIDPATSGDPDGGFILDRPLVSQLEQIGLKPADVEFVGVSHYQHEPADVAFLPAFPEAAR